MRYIKMYALMVLMLTTVALAEHLKLTPWMALVLVFTAFMLTVEDNK